MILTILITYLYMCLAAGIMAALHFAVYDVLCLLGLRAVDRKFGYCFGRTSLPITMVCIVVWATPGVNLIWMSFLLDNAYKNHKRKMQQSTHNV